MASAANHLAFLRSQWTAADKEFQRELLTEVKGLVKKEIINDFALEQESFVRDLPARETPTMPFITGNLHDSIVSVVSSNGRVERASYATSAARTTSSLSGRQVYRPTSGMGRKKIIGALEAANQVRRMQGKYPESVAVTLMVAVPYALNPEEKGRHAGYLENLRTLFATSMAAAFRKATAKGVIQMKGNMEQYVSLVYDPEDERYLKEASSRSGSKGSGGSMGSSRPRMGISIY